MTRRFSKRLALCATFVFGALHGAMIAEPVQAQSSSRDLFKPVVFVNNKAITRYELEQRIGLLRLFRTAGNLEEVALEALITDRLQSIGAELQGIEPSAESVEAGMAEFAQRVNLDTDGFLELLAGNGISMETFRDFVAAGTVWRETVRARFGPRAQVTEAEIDQALALSSRRGGADAYLSELILPATNPEQAAQAEELAQELSQTLTTSAAFAAAATKYSAAPSKENGGRVTNPVPLSNLPGQLRAQILTLGPGETSDPVPIPNGIALFQLRDLRETGLPEASNTSLKYATYLIPGGRSEAALKAAETLRNKVDSCDDLYGINKGKPDALLTIETRPRAQVPAEIGRELALLDPGEVSTRLTRGDALLFLMLCTRAEVQDEEVDRDAIRRRLVGERVAAYADGYLAELRADAIIRYP